MEILVIGCESAGIHLIHHLAAEGHRVTVLDSDYELITALVSQENVVGHLLSPQPLMESLRQAGIGHADAFLALTKNDNYNALAGQVAQHIFHVPNVFCRIDDEDRQQVYTELGMQVVSATAIIAQTIQSALKER
jgi:trk system potassium uptake protein TrkA